MTNNIGLVFRTSCAARLKFLLALAFIAFIGLGHQDSHAQTASVNALTGQACAGTRAAKNLGCTANDFAVGLSFTQPAATAISSCVAGSTLTVDVIASLQSGSPNRYDAGIFFGERGNNPQTNNAAQTCSLGVFPSTPLPYTEFSSANTCGDFFGSSTATLAVTGIRLLCAPAPGSNKIVVPYVAAWDNQIVNTCTTASLTASTNSKCVGDAGLTAAASIVDGLVVYGFVKITKSTLPTYSTQSFTFAASTSPSTTISTTNFSLSNGQSQTVLVALSSTGGTQSVTISESLVSGWESGATISCTNPTGGATSTYIVTNGANRSVTVALSATNYGALCTYTNAKQTRIAASKTVQPAANTSTFNLTASTNLGSATAVNQTSGGATVYVQGSANTSVTVTETSGSNSTITEHVTSVQCTNQDTNAVVPTTSTSLTGSTRTATLTPVSNVDNLCVFTNTRSANLSVTKTNGVTTLASGSTTTYNIVISNGGPSGADGTVISDPVAPGLNCTSVNCTATTGGAACPAVLNTSLLQAGGVTLQSFPANSSVTLAVSCGVTASGS